MLKVLYFHTYPPLYTSGHSSGYRVTRMNTSDCCPLDHNTHIHKYHFHLDIYICMLVGVYSLPCFQVWLSVLENWWVLWSRSGKIPVFMRISADPLQVGKFAEWWASYETKWAS
jgi:hypothetical protein